MCDPLFQIARRLFRKYGIFPTIRPSPGKLVSIMLNFLRTNEQLKEKIVRAIGFASCSHDFLIARRDSGLANANRFYLRLACFHQYQARVRTHGNDSANAVSVEINVVNCGIQAQPECRT